MVIVGDVRDIRGLAKRVHRRWAEYRRRHPGRTVPISDTLSRILEHEPEYRPFRARSESRQRPQLRNPGVFTLQQVAATLETTVGDLLGEPGYRSIRDVVSRADRRTLRQAVTLLRDLFDLDDESLAAPPRSEPEPFLAACEAFVVRDYDYPAPFHAWVIPEGEIALPRVIREIHDPALRVVRVSGDAMAPELYNGWKVVVDTSRTTPEEGTLVAVYSADEGGRLGRWTTAGGTPQLQRPNAPPVPLDGDWTIWGTVTTIVEAPITRR